MDELPLPIAPQFASLVGSVRVEEMHACGRKAEEEEGKRNGRGCSSEGERVRAPLSPGFIFGVLLQKIFGSSP